MRHPSSPLAFRVPHNVRKSISSRWILTMPTCPPPTVEDKPASASG